MSKPIDSAKRSIVIMAVILLFLAAGATGPKAHPASDFYPNLWMRDKSVNWSFETTFPTDGFRSRLIDGATAWNERNEPMTFVRTSSVSPFSFFSCPSTYQKNALHWENIDGKFGKTGQTLWCVFTGTNELFTFQMRVDSSESWYTDTGFPPADKLDLWAVAVHEFGHATGWVGHYRSDDPNQPCDVPPIHTMCPTFPYGFTYQRTLERHDTHTFNNAY